MPRIILETNLVPHGYWNYVDAASGTAFKEATPEALLKKVYRENALKAFAQARKNAKG